MKKFLTNLLMWAVVAILLLFNACIKDLEKEALTNTNPPSNSSSTESTFNDQNLSSYDEYYISNILGTDTIRVHGDDILDGHSDYCYHSEDDFYALLRREEDITGVSYYLDDFKSKEYYTGLVTNICINGQHLVIELSHEEFIKVNNAFKETEFINFSINSLKIKNSQELQEAADSNNYFKFKTAIEKVMEDRIKNEEIEKVLVKITKD